MKKRLKNFTVMPAPIQVMKSEQANKNGMCLGYVSDGSRDRDVLDPSLIKGWREVENGEWSTREDAGVVAISKLSDQYPAADERTKEAGDNATDEEGDCVAPDDGTENLGFKDDQKAKCPVMPVVRKVKDKVKEKVVEAGAAASQWVRRLFPQLMGPGTAETSAGEEKPKVVADGAAASQWVRRLFPQLMGPGTAETLAG
mmetsp:Transcript_79766/g.237607  ORF Transcript_79766/g.237607 Transcript_79766/m.237607 type:complete len:200 (+) Transcript_79766:531-1130(+)